MYVCDTNESCPAGRLPRYRSQQDVRLSYKRILLTIEDQSEQEKNLPKSDFLGIREHIRLG